MGQNRENSGAATWQSFGIPPPSRVRWTPVGCGHGTNHERARLGDAGECVRGITPSINVLGFFAARFVGPSDVQKVGNIVATGVVKGGPVWLPALGKKVNCYSV